MKSATLSEQIRIMVLTFGYGIIEYKSKIKRYFRESFDFAEGIQNYENIPLSMMDRQRGKRSL